MASLAPRLAVLTLVALLVGAARLQAGDEEPPRRRGVPAEPAELSGPLDGIRGRAEVALGRGMPDREANLARGFVLGQDDRIDLTTATDFKRSGLAHLLAVSGQNVMLLALLAAPILGLAGLGLRARLVCILALIAIYVPVTGAGPSIQRAGVMGAAGVIATLAGRPRSRIYAIALAALVTLAYDPHIAGDPGWQLSFAAVIGIAMWSAGIRAWLVGDAEVGGVRRALADGAAVTIAAGLATAPLMAYHFDAVSAATLPANLLALPAVAPAMWLGMLAGMVGQVPALPVEPVNWLNSLFLAYIAQVAHWCAAPSWALVPIRLSSWMTVGAAYACLALAFLSVDGWMRRRLALKGRLLGPGPGRRLALTTVAALLVAFAAGGPAPAESPTGQQRLAIDFLNVGQGDAILLRPSDGDPVLVDGGPRGKGLAAMLARRGVRRLAAAIVTHDQADHTGGVEELLGRLPIGALVYGDRAASLAEQAKGAGVPSRRVAAGSELVSGSLRLTVLWPPAGAPVSQGDPNERALVLVAQVRRFRALLTGDAEAESIPLDPGPVDVLKVAHHGSADEGLGDLLARATPALAVISAGEDNPYGHPAPQTLRTLGQHGVAAMRTDEQGTIEVSVGTRGWAVR